MKRIAIFLFIAFYAINVSAAPAFRTWKSRLLTNGQMVNVMLVGDENGHWFVDEKGRKLVESDNGSLCYTDEATIVTIMKNAQERRKENGKRRYGRMEALNKMNSKLSRSSSGMKRGLVILVDFPDQKFSVASGASVQEYYNHRFNDSGAPHDGYVGSVHDYFYDQSYGKLDIQFDVVGPFRMNEKHSYYGRNYFGNDVYICTMVIEALKKADGSGLDFSQYDWDGDGTVEQVFVLYAGRGENRTQVSDDIWPCEYTLSRGENSGDGSGSQKFDNVIVNTFAVSSELAYDNIPDGIGTACHEFAHCLGFHDHYDTAYSGGTNMQRWDIMAYGNYNGRHTVGEIPAAMTAYERWQAGWLTPIELSKAQDVRDMPALENSPTAYIIYTDSDRDQYFMLENRQPVKWDKGITNDGSAHGLFITYVDYDSDAWASNTINAEKYHQRMTFVPADNGYGQLAEDMLWYQSDAEYAGDTYPGTHCVRDFPNDNANYISTINFDYNKPLHYITEQNGLISFSFRKGTSGISSLESERNGCDDNYYNMQGQSVGRNVQCLKPGIYIKNRKKVLKVY